MTSAVLMESPLAGALVGAVRSQGGVEALPLVEPEMAMPVGFIYFAKSRASRALEAAMPAEGGAA